jgi:penicillin-binding protein 2
MVNLGIGQGELLVSPLQLASYCATIADGGVWHQPHLIRYHTNNRLGTKEMFQYETEDLHLRRDILDLVRGGMFDVVHLPGGTAYPAIGGNDSLMIAGKTGTAQAPGHQFGAKDHSWFISFAPFNAPKIAMCVLIENSGSGAHFAAPISRKLINYFLTRQKSPEDVRADDYQQDNRRLDITPERDSSRVIRDEVPPRRRGGGDASVVRHAALMTDERRRGR